MISRESVEEVKQRVRIEHVVEEQVTLRSAGAGSLKGLCPFHDEKTPSFTVRPLTGTYHCFGCGEGGDVIKFVREIHGLDFQEAVEYLAERSGVVLKYDAASPSTSQPTGVSRTHILNATAIAQQYYAALLAGSQAEQARAFLLERGFNGTHAAQFGLGFSLASHDGLLNHLRKKGFTEAQLEATGLFGRNSNGLYDRFRGRLMFPIHDLTGGIIGFGGRQILPDGTNAKYINPPETKVYNKSRVLYGMYFARKSIKEQRKVIVVEGYTDVMAMHLSGESTAVASCGTAFAHGHVELARRLMGDNANPAGNVLLSAHGAGTGAGGSSLAGYSGNQQARTGQNGRGFHTLGGQVIFTFDGDAAGQAAALKAFNEDQSFAAQTFVAVDPGGHDPCDLWKTGGASAIQTLMAAKVPLFEFVLKSYLNKYDLSLPEGRIGALHACAPVVVQIRDAALRQEYTRILAGWLGLPPDEVLRTVKAARPSPLKVQTPPLASVAAADGEKPPGLVDPERLNWLLSAPRGQIALERLALACLLQYPHLASGSEAVQADANIFSQSEFASIFDAFNQAGGVEGLIQNWASLAGQPPLGKGLEENEALRIATLQLGDLLSEKLAEPLHPLLNSLQTLPLPVNKEEQVPAYIEGIWRGLKQAYLESLLRNVKSEIALTPKGTPRYNELFNQLFDLQKQVNQLKSRPA